MNNIETSIDLDLYIEPIIEDILLYYPKIDNAFRIALPVLLTAP